MCVMPQKLLQPVVFCILCEIHGDAFKDEWMEGVEREDFEECSFITTYAHQLKVQTCYISVSKFSIQGCTKY